MSKWEKESYMHSYNNTENVSHFGVVKKE